MTLQHFLDNYYCKVVIQDLSNNSTRITTEVFWASGKSRACEPISFDIDEETKQKLIDAQHPGNNPKPENPQNLNDLIDSNIRLQLDRVSQFLNVIEYYPLDKNANISNIQIENKTNRTFSFIVQ